MFKVKPIFESSSKISIDPKLCYKKLSRSHIIKDHLEKVKNNLESVKYYGFDMSLVNKDVWLKEPLLNKLNETFRIKGCAYLKLNPFTNYVWHKDTLRGASINMLMTPNAKSYTLFGEEKYGDQIKFIEFEYEPEYFYLFNTQINHTVFNFDKERYIFSAEFEKDKNKLNYSDLYNRIII